MANKVVIDIEARLVDKVSSAAKAAEKGLDGIDKSAKKAQKGLDQLNKTNAKPKITADDSKFTKALQKAQKLCDKLGKTKASALLDAVDKASHKIGTVNSKLKSFVGSYMARLGINTGNTLGTINKITDGLRGIAGKVWRGTIRVLDYATAPIRKITNALFSLKTLFAAVVAGFATQKLVLNPVNLADQYSGAKIGFSTLLGESAGQAMMDEIDKFAKETPFKTSGVISNVQKMMAYGWDVDRVIKDMKTIGDAAAATGKGDQGLESIVYALSEIRSKGKLSTQELNQLASAGIKAKAYLAQGLGYGTSDAGMAKLAKDLEAGAIGANQAIDLILEGMKEFDGMMDRTANETVEGLKSQLEDVFEINIARRWGQGLQDGFKKAMGSVVELLDGADSALQKFGDTIYDVGKLASNWLAERLGNAIERITEITDSFEFQNATLGEKLKMLWKGVVSDPLKDWWENGGREKAISSANKIGKSIGEFLTTAFLGLLGITDIFKESGMDEAGGMSIAKSFAKGFVEGFDVSALTEKLKEAISNVWGALPTWAKVLFGMYGASKIGGVVGNISRLAPVAAAASNGAASLGYWLTGAGTAGTIGGISGAMAAGAGLGAVTAGVGAIHVGRTGYQAYKDFKSGDTTSGWANTARSGLTAIGIGGGAALGAKAGAAIGTVGGPVGTLIGAGLGTLVGWFAGDKIARHIEAAKYETKELQKVIKDKDATADEKAEALARGIWQNKKEHFGDIVLSLQEIERLANQIVLGDDTQNLEQYTSAAKQAEASYQSMADAASEMERWNWKARLGVKFNEDEIESYKASVDDYIRGAKSYVENKHYEFTAAVSLLVDVNSEKGKSILESGNAYYSKIQKQLDDLGGKLSSKVDIALKDGVITLDEQKEITNLQQQIAEITNKLAEAESSAELDLIKLKFGGGQIDADSFANLQAQIQTTIDDKMGKTDKAFTTSLASLKLQLSDGAINEEQYNEQLQTLISGYKGSIESLNAEVKGVQLDIIAEAYEGVLGDDARKKLETALDKSLKEGINPKEWTLEEAKRLLGVDDLTGETAGALGDYLASIADQLDSMEVDGDLYVKLNPKSNADEAGDKVKKDAESSIDKRLASDIEKELGIKITGNKEIMNTIEVLESDFGIPEAKAAYIALMLTGNKEIQNHVDVIAKEFGIPESKAEDIILKLYGNKMIANSIGVSVWEYGIPPEIAETLGVNLTGNKNIMNTLSVTAGDFGISDTISKTVSVVVNAKKVIGNTLKPWEGNDFRGGIEGFSDGGYVRGGGKLIRVAEEGDPEAVIPLGLRRRQRALALYNQVGNILGANGYATGGIIGGGSTINREPHIIQGNFEGGERTIKVDVGGIELNVRVEGGQDVVEAIQNQKEKLAEEIAGIINKAISSQYENMPSRKGA